MDAKPSPDDAAIFGEVSRLVEAYLTVGSVFVAAAECGVQLLSECPTSGCYVYCLSDENGLIFYVGKGKGRRMASHRKEAHRLNRGNNKKRTMIARLGDNMREVVLFSGLSESDAFRIERSIIAKIGYDNLSNIARGNYSKREAAMHDIKHRLSVISKVEENPQGQWTERDRLARRIVREYVIMHDQLNKGLHFDSFKVTRSPNGTQTVKIKYWS